MRAALIFKGALVLELAFRLHHQFQGPPIDYAGLFAAAAASWVGIPGPGEPVLIAAGIFAAHHKLDIGTVIFMAWLGATVGGIAGWLIGMKLGRRALAAKGPLWRVRLKALARGDEVFARYTVYAILLTPSWIAGINRAPTRAFLLTNAAGAALWAGGIGLGAYFLGPAVIDLVADLGLITVAGLALLITVAVVAEIRRRRRRAVPRST